MSGAPRRTLDEFVSSLKYEPTSFSIVVEGIQDGIVVNGLLRWAGHDSFKVYDVGSLHVPAELFDGGITPSGNRSRVIMVADYVREQLPGGQAPLACIVDRDLEAVDEVPRGDQPYLMLTDGPSLDSIFHDVTVLDCVLTRFVQAPGLSPAALLDSIASVCHEVFLVRVADARLRLDAGALNPAADCDFRQDRIHFEAERYLERYCLRPTSGLGVDIVKPMIDEIRMSASEFFPLVNGHDFVGLLRESLAEVGADRQLIRPTVLRRALLSCVRFEEIQHLPMFRDLLERVVKT